MATKAFTLTTLVLTIACGARPAPVQSPDSVAQCRSVTLPEDSVLELNALCGTSTVIGAGEIPAPYTVSTRDEAYRGTVQHQEEAGHQRVFAQPIRVAVGGQWHEGLLGGWRTAETGVPYEMLTVLVPNGAGSRFLHCRALDHRACIPIVNYVGGSASLSDLQASLPPDLVSAETARRNSLSSCVPSDRLRTADYGTLERVTQLACDERTLVVAEELGTLTDETRHAAFERFVHAFQAVNSEIGTFAVNGVRHPAAIAERSEPDGTRMMGIAVLLPLAADRHKLLLCTVPNDVDQCSILMNQLATMAGTGLFGNGAAQATVNSAPTAETPSTPTPAAPATPAPHRRARPHN